MRFALCAIAVAVSSAVIAGCGSKKQAMDRTGPMEKGYISIGNEVQPIWYIAHNGLAVAEGDVVLGPVDRMREISRRMDQALSLKDENAKNKAKSAVILEAPIRGRLWIHGEVQYMIDSSLPNPGRVFAAIQHWTQNTSIRFVKRTTQLDYVTFQPDPDSCDSYVGRQYRQQVINLAAGCDSGSVIHEIGHAVGLFHEQSRWDRDRYVEIRFQNVQQTPNDMRNQFFKANEPAAGLGGFASVDFGPYDYDSVMQYTAYAFSANGQPTIVPRDPTVNINRLGSRVLSSGDINGVQYLYGTILAGWDHIDGKGREIAAGKDGSVYVVGTSRQDGAHGFDVWKWDGSRGWTVIPGIAAVKIAVAPDGTLWHVNDLGAIYRGRQPIQGGAREIAIGAEGSVYVVGTSRQDGARGFDVWKFDGSNGWTVVPRVAATKIAVAPDGTLWHINELGDLYRGTTQINLWKAREISIGPDGSIYLVSYNGRPPGDAKGYVLFRWMNESYWYLYPDTAVTKVATDPQGHPWVLNEDNDIFRRI